MISHKDIMTGSLGMGRARNSLQWPLSTRAAERDDMRLTGCQLLISSMPLLLDIWIGIISSNIILPYSMTQLFHTMIL